MKIKVLRAVSLIMTILMLITSCPLNAAAVSSDQILNAATKIIISNEGNYTTVVRNDNGALSIGKLGWHATNALNLLKEIIAKNPNQARNILGRTLYNEIITTKYWETRIATKAEASVMSVLLATQESREVQDKTAKEYISKYINHGINLGITDPAALVFFADYENQNGYTGAAKFHKKVINTYGVATLKNLYNTSNKSSRRTRTYNFCISLKWEEYSDEVIVVPTPPKDTQAPEISNVALSGLTSSGYTISCSVSDNDQVTEILFAVYHQDDGSEKAIWYKNDSTSDATFTLNISEFGNRSGNYYTYIYAFDASGNYSYVQLNAINVPSATPPAPEFSLTVSSNSDGVNGGVIKWSAQAANGSGRYLYAFDVYKDGKVVYKRNYNDFSDLTYTVEKTGKYTAVVTARDTVSGKTASTTSNETEILEPIVAKSFTANASQIFLGEQICWIADVTGGEDNLKYSYTVYHNEDTVIESTPFTTEKQFLFTPTEPGIYNVTVNITDDRAQAISVKSANILVVEKLSAKLTFSQYHAAVGKTVSCSANVSGGSGNYTCTFIVYFKGDKVLEKTLKNTDTVSFTVPESGEYTASAVVTDADSTIIELQQAVLTVVEKAEKGDANCDGELSASDARYTLRCSSGMETIDKGLVYAADVNEDGEITASDARMILRVVAQLDTF